MTEIRIAALLAASSKKIEYAILLVDPQQLSNRPFAAGDLILQPARRRIVEIQMTPIVALGKPNHFVRSRHVVPVDPTLARLVLRHRFLFEYIANGAGCSVSNAKLRVFVIARCRNERELCTVTAPLHVGPLATAAYEVVAE